MWPLGVEVCGLVGRAALAGRAWRPFAPVEPPWASPPPPPTLGLGTFSPLASAPANAGLSEVGSSLTSLALTFVVSISRVLAPLPLASRPFTFQSPNPPPARGGRPLHPGAGQVRLAFRQVQSWFPCQRGDEVKQVCGHSPQTARIPLRKLFSFIFCPWASA